MEKEPKLEDTPLTLKSVGYSAGSSLLCGIVFAGQFPGVPLVGKDYFFLVKFANLFTKNNII